MNKAELLIENAQLWAEKPGGQVKAMLRITELVLYCVELANEDMDKFHAAMKGNEPEKDEDKKTKIKVVL